VNPKVQQKEQNLKNKTSKMDESLLKRVDLLKDEGKYQEAIQLIKQLHGDRSLMEVAACYELVGDSKEAIQCYTTWLSQNEPQKKVLLKRAECHLHVKQFGDAYKDVVQCISLDEKDLALYRTRGKIVIRMGRFDLVHAAEKDFSYYLASHPGDLDALFYRMNCYSIMDNHKSAIEDATKRVSLDPSRPQVYYERGNVYYEADQEEEAKKDYQKCIELGASGSCLVICNAFVFQIEKKYQESIDQLSGCEISVAHKLRARCFYFLQQFPRAVEDYEKYYARAFRTPRVQDERAMYFASNKEYQRAIESCHICISWRPTPIRYIIRGILYRILKKYEEAIADYKQSIVCEPSDLSLKLKAHEELAACYLELSDNECAQTHLDCAIQSCPHNNKKTLQCSLKNLCILNRYDKVLEILDGAYPPSEYAVQNYGIRGQIACYTKNYKASVEYYNLSIDACRGLNVPDTESCVIYHNRGMAYMNLLQFDEAIADFDKSLQLNPKEYSNFGSKAQCFEQKGQYELAIEQYRNSLMHKDSVDCRVRLACCLVRIGKYKDCFLELESVDEAHKGVVLDEIKNLLSYSVTKGKSGTPTVTFCANNDNYEVKLKRESNKLVVELVEKCARKNEPISLKLSAKIKAAKDQRTARDERIAKDQQIVQKSDTQVRPQSEKNIKKLGSQDNVNTQDNNSPQNNFQDNSSQNNNPKENLDLQECKLCKNKIFCTQDEIRVECTLNCKLSTHAKCWNSHRRTIKSNTCFTPDCDGQVKKCVLNDECVIWQMKPYCVKPVQQRVSNDGETKKIVKPKESKIESKIESKSTVPQKVEAIRVEPTPVEPTPLATDANIIIVKNSNRDLLKLFRQEETKRGVLFAVNKDSVVINIRGAMVTCGIENVCGDKIQKGSAVECLFVKNVIQSVRVIDTEQERETQRRSKLDPLLESGSEAVTIYLRDVECKTIYRQLLSESYLLAVFRKHNVQKLFLSNVRITDQNAKWIPSKAVLDF